MKKATDSFFSQTKETLWSLVIFMLERMERWQNFGWIAKELSEIADIINANTSKIKEAWNGFFFK